MGKRSIQVIKKGIVSRIFPPAAHPTGHWQTVFYLRSFKDSHGAASHLYHVTGVSFCLSDLPPSNILARKGLVGYTVILKRKKDSFQISSLALCQNTGISERFYETWVGFILFKRNPQCANWYTGMRLSTSWNILDNVRKRNILILMKLLVIHEWHF